MAISTKQQVLTALLQQPAAWLSGDELAKRAGVSRESVWKAINALRKAGHQIDSGKNRGYHYAGSQQLDALAIKINRQNSLNGPIEVVTTTASTQNLAKQFLSQQAKPQIAAFFADQQTAGYGRFGRNFYSPAQTGLYFSLVLPNPQNDLQHVGLLTTGVVVGVLRVLQRFFPQQDFSLKWVNDILIGNQKVGGIITEASLEVESTSTAAFIVGVGLNLTTAAFPPALKAIARGIDRNGTVDRNRLAAALLDELVTVYQQYPTGAFLPTYRENSRVLGRQVVLNVGERQVAGRAEAIDDQGGLVIKTARGQLETFTSGEVVKVQPA